MKTDSIFYQLFLIAPQLFFELVGQPTALAKQYQFKSVELKQTAFRIDGVFLPTQTDRPVYFVEVQFQKDNLLYHRFFAEILLYLKQYPATPDWHGLLIYPDRRTMPDIPHALRHLLTLPSVQMLCLDELEATDSPLIQLVQLITAPETTAPTQAQQLVEHVRTTGIPGIPTSELLELIETILVYKLPRLTREEIEAMIASSFRETRVYQDALQEGIQQGLETGIQQGQAKLVLRLLTRRFGPITPALQIHIQHLSSDQLDDLAEALLDFTQLTELETWLRDRPIPETTQE